MSNVLFLLSQYELLERLAQYLRTVDLINLALTCSEYYGRIRQSEQIFERLKRVALCDGRGLKSRQEFSGEFALSDRHFKWGPCGRKANYDEEVEVRVWNLRCDATNPLPCLRCDINACEVCLSFLNFDLSITILHRNVDICPGYAMIPGLIRVEGHILMALGQMAW
jgi:hypothetical protein